MCILYTIILIHACRRVVMHEGVCEEGVLRHVHICMQRSEHAKWTCMTETTFPNPGQWQWCINAHTAFPTRTTVIVSTTTSSHPPVLLTTPQATTIQPQASTRAATTLLALASFNNDNDYPCHDRNIPPQPSHTYLCLLTVQTPPEQSLTKPKPIPGLPDPSTAFLNPSAAFPKGCCTDVCLVSIPEVVNTIPKHIWPFPMNPKHLKSYWPTLSLHAHLRTWRLSMCNHNWAKPKHLAVFLIESHSFSLILIIICPSLPLSHSLLSLLSSINPVSI